ncbi:EAL domain-containing protein [Acinetobacter sp.]|uniref:EAL domain-containing protein n=1 Tax=Acinetobacter sp. TaxID=472 RepID=UPI0035B424D5
MKLLLNDKKSQTHVVRFLMVDSQQNTLNIIQQGLKDKFNVNGKLLDDLSNFDKMLNLQWDVILFKNAYDFDYEKALEIIESKNKVTPIILLTDDSTESAHTNKAYQKGIFDIVNTTDLEQLAVSIARATAFSRLLRKETQLSKEIDKLQQQTQTLVETTEYAVATFQEGVHVSANPQYAELFGFSDIEELIGLPLMDVLQPEDVQSFKQSYKKLSRGDFGQAAFNIQSRNAKAKYQNLNLQFSETEYDDETALQLVIASEAATTSSSGAFAPLTDVQLQCQQVLDSQPFSALLLFKIKQFAADKASKQWDTSTHFFQAIQHHLEQISSARVLRISEHVFTSTLGVADKATLKQKLNTISESLAKQIQVADQSIPVTLQLCYHHLDQNTVNDQVALLLTDTYQHHYDPASEVDLSGATDLSLTSSQTPSFSLSESAPTIQFESSPASQPALASIVDATNDASLDESEKSLVAQLDNNTIQLQFQQLYDKEDIDGSIFEVTGSFEFEQQQIPFSQYDALRRNAELAARVDRWILVEASKRLHQFLQKVPKARILVNIHAASLHDATIQGLLNKLVGLINSKYAKPLILQINEADILMNKDQNTQAIKSIQEQGVDVAIAEFGDSIYSVHLLQQLDLAFAKLTKGFTSQLQNDESMVELQEKIDQFREHNSAIRFLISHLDDMTSFANAWNVDVRYLQGDYYQPKQKEFVNSAG